MELLSVDTNNASGAEHKDDAQVQHNS